MGASSSKTSLEDNLELFLIGKTGHGKSSTGNSILGQKVFEVRDSTSRTTIKIGSACKMFNDNLIIKVVDGPGPMDTTLTGRALYEHTSRQLGDSFVECPKGFHALLLVLKYGPRYTIEEKNTVVMLKAMFGSNFFKQHCIIIFTHGESFDINNEYTGKTFSEWCDELTGHPLGNLIQECQNRVVLFYNKSPEKYDDARSKLISLVQALPGRYTHSLFQRIYLERQMYIKKHGTIQLKDVVEVKISCIINMLTEMESQPSESDLLLSELDELEEIINKERPDLKVIKDIKIGIQQAREKQYFQAKTTFKDIQYVGRGFFPNLLENIKIIVKGVLMKAISW